VLAPVLAPSQPVGQGPVLEYDIYTFTNTSKANVTLYLSPSLNQMGRSRPLRYAIAFDAEMPQVRQFVADITGLDGAALPVSWEAAVSDAVWGLSENSTTTTHDLSTVGRHTLKFWALEPGVVFQKIILDLGGVRVVIWDRQRALGRALMKWEVMMGQILRGLMSGRWFDRCEVRCSFSIYIFLYIYYLINYIFFRFTILLFIYEIILHSRLLKIS